MAFAVVALLHGESTAAANAQAVICQQPTGKLAPLQHSPEASGAAISRRTPGVIWTHNDSGEPVIDALDSTGKFRARVRVTGARLVNWEDMAVGPCPAGSCVYVADIGDNGASRREIVVYRVPEPSLTDRQTRAAEAFRATYPGGPRDAEAIFVLPDSAIFVVSKGENGPVVLYRFPAQSRIGQTTQLERVATLAIGRVARNLRITGASASADGRWVVLRTLGAVYFYRADRLTKGIAGGGIEFDIKRLQEVQGEGVALAANGTVYLTGEGGGRGRPGTFGVLRCTLPPA
jgi:hypothetical protein